MKTPQEWVKELESPGKSFIVVVTAIQVEAETRGWRQGMTDAARIVYDPLGQSHNPATAHDRFNAKKAILAARDAKEEKP